MITEKQFHELKVLLYNKHHSEVEKGRRHAENVAAWIGTGQPGVVDAELSASRASAVRADVYRYVRSLVLEMEAENKKKKSQRSS